MGALLFDFWGTLLDHGTYSPIRQTYKIMRPRMRFGDFVPRFEQAFMTATFESQEQAFKAAAEELHVRLKPFMVDKLIGLWNKSRLLAQPYPETFTVLEDLKKEHKLVLLSNTDCFVESVLNKFEIEKYFDLIALSYQTGLLKQDAKSFALVAKKLKMKKNDLIMIGDSMETDINGAERAGVRAILVDRRDRRAHDPKIADLTGLKEVL
ncbi:HAD-IA family hydrolase [Candidatus Woesearchaeota archaeon]|nr:HAD-IA family hydrolase [Candidatus Woesearchaeota archaeon]